MTARAPSTTAATSPATAAILALSRARLFCGTNGGGAAQRRDGCLGSGALGTWPALLTLLTLACVTPLRRAGSGTGSRRTEDRCYPG